MYFHRKLALLFVWLGIFAATNGFSQQSKTDELSRDSIARDRTMFPEALFSSPIYVFIDHYLNRLSSLPSQSSRLSLLHEDMVSLRFNGTEAKESKLPIAIMLDQITPYSTFTLNEHERNFHASWEVNEGAGIVEFIFPKQYDLILGKDKKELTQLFGTDLLAHTYEYDPDFQVTLFNEKSFLEAYSIFADLGDSYIIPQMKSGQYIQRKEGYYDFVLNERMGKESLLNLFSNADRMNRSNQLKLIIKGYDTSDTIAYRLDYLCSYMRDHSCKAYLGLETETEDEYTGTVFYVNKELMYKHLFYFHFPKSALKREQNVVTIKVYPYIPINNIGDLYEDVTLDLNL